MTDGVGTSEGRIGGDVRGRVAAILQEGLGILVPSPEADLLESGHMDSLSLVELLLALEREFAVVVSWDELEIDEFRSLAAISDFVVRNRG